MTSTPADSLPQQPKRSFGIAEMLLFTGIVAVSFACSCPSSHVPGRPNPDSMFWKIFLGLPEVTKGVLSLSGAALVFARWRRCGEGFNEPGRVLLLLLAAIFCLSNVLETFYIFLIGLVEEKPAQPNLLFAGLTYVKVIPPLFLAAICVLGLKGNRNWWRVAFCFLAVAHLSSIATAIAIFLMSIDQSAASVNFLASLRMFILGISVVAVLSILICCVIDVAKHIKRSRLHWYGVVCYMICLVLPPLFRLIAFRFLSANEYFGI